MAARTAWGIRSAVASPESHRSWRRRGWAAPRQDEALLKDILSRRRDRRPVTAVVANLADPKDAGRRKAVIASGARCGHDPNRISYTLVLSKTDALFAREREARQRDQTDLAWLGRTFVAR
jgi:hypothetical protein